MLVPLGIGRYSKAPIRVGQIDALHSGILQAE